MIKEALELLRRARNNLPRDEFEKEVAEATADGNVYWPLVEAYLAAKDAKKRS